MNQSAVVSTHHEDKALVAITLHWQLVTVNANTYCCQVKAHLQCCNLSFDLNTRRKVERILKGRNLPNVHYEGKRADKTVGLPSEH